MDKEYNNGVMSKEQVITAVSATFFDIRAAISCFLVEQSNDVPQTSLLTW
jgi:hypothetical protein